ncbi:hypothetical protein HUU39_01600 [candidate division KSB1 bacterium]|nr:hypothetical protein [bacterium]NUM63959.1 hypothetical protein [candidate division KSB1 bacterium]
MEDQLAFNARAVFTWRSDRLYRVHLSGNELFFIRLGGQGGWREGALGGMHGQPLGLLLLPVVWLLDRWAQKKREAKMARSDARPPQLQVREHIHNFRLAASDVVAASLEPPARLQLHGYHVGRWRLVTAGGQKFNFQFETLADMQWAQAILSRVLADRLQISVRWDPRRGRSVRLTA